MMPPAPGGKRYYVRARTSLSRSAATRSVSSSQAVSITDTTSAGGRYLQLTALLRQENQHVPFILLRAYCRQITPISFSRLKSWLSVPESGRTRAPIRETVRPPFSHSTSTDRSAPAVSAGAKKVSSWQGAPGKAQSTETGQWFQVPLRQKPHFIASSGRCRFFQAGGRTAAVLRPVKGAQY